MEDLSVHHVCRILFEIRQNKKQCILRGRKWRVCIRDGATAIPDMTINRVTLHICFKCGVKDRNQCVKLVSGQSSHRTSFRRVFDDGSILAIASPSISARIKIVYQLNLDEVYCKWLELVDYHAEARRAEAQQAYQQVVDAAQRQ